MSFGRPRPAVAYFNAITDTYWATSPVHFQAGLARAAYAVAAAATTTKLAPNSTDLMLALLSV